MRWTYHLTERIRRGEHIPLPVAAVLTTATPMIRFGMWLRRRRPRIRVPARVISFGNLTVGGSGKTPAVIERARVEMAAGHKVAVLTRGYGSQHRGRLEVVVAGPKRAGYSDWLGDEPELIARHVPSVVIAKGSDRVMGASTAIEEFGCDTLIMDDGFQYLRLERDENVLVIDATNPFGNGRLFPRGILREPVEAAARATHILLTRCDHAADLDRLVARLKELCPGAPIRKTRHAPTSLWRVSNGEGLPMESLRGERITALCAIANPDSFFRTLEDMGALVQHRLAYRDHYPLTLDAIPSSGLVVTTEKDAMRLHHAPNHVLALGIELQET